MTDARRPAPIRKRALRFVLALGATFVLAAVPQIVAADGVKRGYQVRDDDSARFDTIEFRQHAARGHWRQAILKLQELFDTPPQRAVVVEIEGSRPPRFQSVRTFAQSLFDALPPEGVAAWEQIERRPAEELLARGLRLRRVEDLEAVVRRYPHKDVRRRGRDALAHLAMARGEFERAADNLAELALVAEAAEQPGIAARIAFAQAQMGDVDGVRQTAARNVQHGDAQVPGPEGKSVRLREFFASMEVVARASAPRFAGARQFGGDRHGRNVSEPPPKSASLGWQAPVDFTWGTENEGSSRYPYQDSQATPLRPVIAQGAMFLNTGLSVTAIEASTGRRLWRRDGPLQDAQWRDNPAQHHTVAVADGVVYAPLATRSDAPTMRTRRAYTQLIVYALPHRSLHAIDARSGEILWAHDGPGLADRPDAEEIERESVASAPLVVGEDVIVSTWTYNSRYEVRLVCFDRRTGATKWRTSLIHGQQEMNLFGRAVKELLTSSIAELDGNVYFATGLGIAACLDRVTGEVRWLSEYEQSPIPPTYAWYETIDRDVAWRPSAVAATRSAVLMAPCDSPKLTAFDPATGKQLWTLESAAPNGLRWNWLLGVRKDRAYVLGSRLGAFDVATGRAVWTAAGAGVPAEEGRARPLVVGSGILTESAVYVPTHLGIAEMDAETGACVAVRPLGTSPGRRGAEPMQNLLSGDGALGVWSVHGVSCYYDFEQLRDRLFARIQDSPKDPWLRLEAGDIFRSASRWDDAVSCFEQGLAHVESAAPAARDSLAANLRRGLFDALVRRSAQSQAAGDGAAACSDLERAAGVAPSEDDAVRALFALQGSLLRVRRNADAKAVLAKILAEHGDVETDAGGEDDRSEAGALALHRLAVVAAAEQDDAAAIALWFRILAERRSAVLGSGNAAAFAREQIAAFAAARGPDVAKLVRDGSRKLLDAAIAAKDAPNLSILARNLPDAEAAADAAIEAGRIHLAAGRGRDAAAILEHVLGSAPPPATRARALEILVASYRTLDETARERAALRRMASEVPDEKTSGGVKVADFAKAELAAERFAETAAVLPTPRVPPPLRWESDPGAPSGLQILSVQGGAPKGTDDALLFREDGVVSLRSGADGSPLWRVPSDVEPRAVYGARTAFLVVGSEEGNSRVARIEAIRASDGRPLWSRPMPGRYTASAAGLGVVYLLVQTPGDTGNLVSKLHAFSAESGEPVAEAVLPRDIYQGVALQNDAFVLFEQISQGSSRRRAITLDATTLALRGTVEIDGFSSPYVVAVPGTNIVATGARGDRVAAIDVSRGTAAWPAVSAGGKPLKSILAAPGGLIVCDGSDQVRRIDAVTGREVWVRDLSEFGELGYAGEAAEGDLVVLTLLGRRGKDGAMGIALDAATGAVRWKTALPLEGSSRRLMAHPEMLAGHVAYEMNQRLETEENSCRVLLLDRRDGSVAATVVHPRLTKGRQSARWAGPNLVLMTPDTAQIAVYGGPVGSAR